ncbi:putative hydro-lyase [Pectinatus frisingensis]|uniref:putative hydro-lyase n=1 Tax=Pectinatus frisingensis TaxID=865 RepID=UPI0018C4A7A6|nr:putative hydro-lyase [Pectinatus frisingensis]
MNYADFTPKQVRQLVRDGKISVPTSGMCNGYAQANMVILPKELAFDFLLFCQRNKKPCPLLDVTEAGSPIPRLTAPTADLRYDIPRYRIYRHGELTDEVDNIAPYWSNDLVAFLLGCSFSFESPMLEAGLEIRHITDNHNVPMYLTNIECIPAGVFHGPMVVSMRPMKPADAIRAIQITTRMPFVHGAPIHLGNPEMIGIKDINKPDFGEPSKIYDGEIPVFWACGVTPQSIAMTVKPAFMITHAPGYMFITDIPNAQLAIM